MTGPTDDPTDRSPNAAAVGVEGGATNGTNGSRRILLVSQDLVQRGRLYDLLTHHGYSVKTVYSTERALATLRHEHPHLILVGSCDDACGGLGLPNRVRSFDAELPIVLLGDANHSTMHDQRIRQDVQVFLPDAVTEERLLDAIERAAGSSRPAKPVHYPGPILLVDDEPELLRTLKDFLEVRGCPAVTAASGEEAVDLLKRCAPTLVLLDIKLGGMDGLITLQKIKELYPRVPIIMATAVEDQELMTQAFALGAYEYLIKPYNLAALQAILIHLKTLLML